MSRRDAVKLLLPSCVSTSVLSACGSNPLSRLRSFKEQAMIQLKEWPRWIEMKPIAGFFNSPGPAYRAAIRTRFGASPLLTFPCGPDRTSSRSALDFSSSVPALSEALQIWERKC